MHDPTAGLGAVLNPGDLRRGRRRGDRRVHDAVGHRTPRDGHRPTTAKLAQLVRLGLGGVVASGRQWVSWVALDDVVGVLLRAIDDPSMRGTYHVTSPNPVTNAEMMATYRRLLGRRIGLPAPALVARLGAPILGSSASLALTGRRCMPRRLLDEGFAFATTGFEAAASRALEQAGLR